LVVFRDLRWRQEPNTPHLALFIGCHLGKTWQFLTIMPIKLRAYFADTSGLRKGQKNAAAAGLKNRNYPREPVGSC
jgi:hypothetical protein